MCIISLMSKNCEIIGCHNRGFRKVLVREKKNKEYKLLCQDHHDAHTKSQNYECDWESCTLLGEFKAPSKIGDDFLWFCEDFMFQDIVGHKKTQKFGSMDNFFHQLWNNAIEDELLIISKFKQTLAKDDQKYSEKQITALKKMELKPNVSWVAVKEQFKKLVKKYHPDMNAGNKQYEEKLKEITIAYSYLKTSLTDRQKTV